MGFVGRETFYLSTRGGISAPVGGAGAANHVGDVSRIQYLFNIIGPFGARHAVETGICGPTLIVAIK